MEAEVEKARTQMRRAKRRPARKEDKEPEEVPTSSNSRESRFIQPRPWAGSRGGGGGPRPRFGKFRRRKDEVHVTLKMK